MPVSASTLLVGTKHKVIQRFINDLQQRNVDMMFTIRWSDTLSNHIGMECNLALVPLFTEL